MIEAKQHPNADRLRVCIVDTGVGRAGAGRVRRAERAHRHEGRVRAARHLHPGQEHRRSASARSAASRAAACWSPRCELQLSDDHEGIIDLPEDAPVGQSYAAYAGLDDPVIEINLTPNRPDCTSVHGIARDLAAAGLGQAQGDAVQPVQGAGPCPVSRHPRLRGGRRASLPGLRAPPRARREERRLAGLDAAAPRRDRAAPDQRARRHHQLRHLRPRPAAARLRRRQGQGRSHRPPRARRRGDRSRSTGAPTRSTIRSSSSPTRTASESIAGIMGGEHSGCDETHDRRADRIGAVGPAQHRADRAAGSASRPMRATASSAASIRPSPCPASISRPGMVLELCGGEAVRASRRGRDPGHRPHHRLPLDRGAAPLRPRRAARRNAKVILEELGFHVAGTGDRVKVLPPSWRPDIEGKADLVEEVIRIVGLDRIAPQPLPRARRTRSSRPILTPIQKRTRLAKRLLAARGPRRGRDLVLHRQGRRRSSSAAATSAWRSRTRSPPTSPTCARASCRDCSRRRSAMPTAPSATSPCSRSASASPRTSRRGRPSRRRRSGAAPRAPRASAGTGTAARSRSTPSTPRPTRWRS